MAYVGLSLVGFLCFFKFSHLSVRCKSKGTLDILFCSHPLTAVVPLLRLMLPLLRDYISTYVILAFEPVVGRLNLWR